MGVKVGPQAFQKNVSDCLKSLQPHTHIYIDDLLTGTRPKLCGKGKILDSKAYLEDHFQNLVKLFDRVEQCHHKVRFEKCHLCMERIKYYGCARPVSLCPLIGNYVACLISVMTA